MVTEAVICIGLREFVSVVDEVNLYTSALQLTVTTWKLDSVR